jgi:DNA replication protein DnaC
MIAHKPSFFTALNDLNSRVDAGRWGGRRPPGPRNSSRPISPPSPSTTASASSSRPSGPPERTDASSVRSKKPSLKLSQACIEAIDYPARRELDKAVIRQLATCRWIAEHHNVILVGATGVGKSFIACALAHQACRKGHRAGYRRASRLFHELTLARADGTYIRLLGKLARLDVLLIDDWGLAPVQDQERRDLLEILEDRYATRSTIITSQLPPAQWHDYLADATLADSICDRLLHNAHRIVLQGPSRRKEAKLDH